MKLIKAIFQFYINASIHVALAVYALAWITLLEFEISYDEDVLYFIFYASITGYNFIKYFGLAKFHHRSLANWLKVIQIFSLLCFLLMCYYFFRLEQGTWIYLLGLILITFLYAIPFLPKEILFDNQQNLRSITGIKIYAIALVWSGVTVVLPLVNNEIAFNNDVLVTFLQRFVFVIVLVLPFDIRDLKYDSIRLSTIPQKLGVKTTKLVGMALLGAFLAMEYLKDEVSLKGLIILFSIVIITTVLLLFSRKDQSAYYSAFIVEGIPILWLGFLLI